MLNCHTLQASPARLPRIVAALGLALLFAAPAWAQRDWRVCASEGQTCRIDGETMVRFGAEDRYVFRVSSESLPCEIDSFGSDPAPGIVKRCELSRDWRSDSRYRNWRRPGEGATAGWQLCAYEGDFCRLPAGATQLRYGQDGRYVERSVTGGMACNNGGFGRDPYPGVAKQCEYRIDGASGSWPSQPASGLPWNTCASEGGYCNFRGPGMLRYGAAGRYVYREAVNGQRCGNDEFGGDPAPGMSKRCEMLRLGR